jgi:ABC-type sugar transport system ATPase subunit
VTENIAPNGDVLRVEHVSKRYGAVTALTDINLRLGKGEVLSLIGDNGAGKSTLLKIICGFQPPTTGKIILEGEEVQLKSVDHARSLGIDAVYQDLAVINQLTVYQNMFLNREKVRWPLLNSRAMRREAKERLDEMGVQIPLLDEPLAAMGVKEGSLILELITQLKEQGNVSIIIIAHNYGQVLEVSDRVNLIQDGKITFDKRSSETSADELTEMVVAEYRRALEERRRGRAAS